MSASKADRAWALLLVAAVAGAAYLSVLPAGFTWDDSTHTLSNPAIFSFRPAHFFTVGYWDREFAYPGLYRPFHALTLALDYAVWKDAAFGYHLTNVLLHAIASMAVAWLVAVCSGRWRAAVLAGLVFAVLPGHVEAVAWVKNRSVLLATAFGAAGVALYWRAVSERFRLLPYGLALGAFACALCSQPISVTLPAWLVVVALAGLPRSKWRKALGLAAPFVAGAAGFLLFRKLAFTRGTFAGVPDAPAIGLLQHASIVADTVLFYARMLVLPVNLGPDRVFPLERTVDAAAWWRMAAAAACGIGLLWAGWRSRRLGWVLIFGLGMGAIINLSIIAGRPLAEQRLYWPSVGLCAWFADTLSQRRRRRAGLAFAAIVPLAALCIYPGTRWRTALTFWEHAVRVAPTAARAQEWRGVSLKEQGRYTLAEAHLLKAVALNRRLASSWKLLGELWVEQGKFADAERALKTAVELRPRDSIMHNSLGVLYAKQAQWPAAIGAFSDALEMDPHNTIAAANLAKAAAHAASESAVYAGMVEALSRMEQAGGSRSLNPVERAAVEGLWARLLLEQDEPKEALKRVEAALRFAPQDEGLHSLKQDAERRLSDRGAARH